MAAPSVGGLGLGLDRGRNLGARLGEPPRMPKRNKLVIVTVSALDDLREGWRCQRKQTSGQSAGQSNLHPSHFHLPLSFFEVIAHFGTDEGIQFWRYSA